MEVFTELHSGKREKGMTENGWILLATLIIGFLNTAFMAWIKYKQGVAEDKTDKIAALNQSQDVKLNTIHADINGRVDQLISTKVHEQIATAVAIAVAAALKQERDQTQSMAKQSAEALIATAKQAAEELKEEKKKP